MSDRLLIDSLRRAVAADPNDPALRLHLAEMLLATDAERADEDRQEAIVHISHVLAQDPANAEARRRMQRAIGLGDSGLADSGLGDSGGTSPPLPDRFDWDAAEQEVADIARPAFIDPEPSDHWVPPDNWVTENQPGDDRMAELVEVTPPRDLTLADVGGLDDVKARLELSFLGPIRHPELRQLYGKQLRGGLLLYGPPGCGKSHLAEALAGELRTSWVAIHLHDVLDMWIGAGERNLHALFETARRAAPCVVFIDELDALGQRRANLRNSGLRTMVNQLLVELDGTAGDNEGLYVIAATNHPWDIDPALRRPGRLGHMILVPPPDAPARQAIFRTHLQNRPVEGIDLGRLARTSEGFSGADIAHACEMATERALADSMRSGTVRMITMNDLDSAVAATRPSTATWFDTARNVVMFANEGGDYDDLRDYMKKHRLR